MEFTVGVDTIDSLQGRGLGVVLQFKAQVPTDCREKTPPTDFSVDSRKFQACGGEDRLRRPWQLPDLPVAASRRPSQSGYCRPRSRRCRRVAPGSSLLSAENVAVQALVAAPPEALYRAPTQDPLR